MGTRNLTMVLYGGKSRICQYGQWDGYPTGAGREIQSFLRKYLEDVDFHNKFIYNLKLSVPFYPGMEDEYKALCEKRKSKGLSMEHDNRDMGAEVLEWLANTSPESLGFYNDLDFLMDNTFNEYTYVFDVDKETVSIYTYHRYIKPVENSLDYNPLAENGYNHDLGFLGTWNIKDFVEEDMEKLEDYIYENRY